MRLLCVCVCVCMYCTCHNRIRDTDTKDIFRCLTIKTKPRFCFFFFFAFLLSPSPPSSSSEGGVARTSARAFVCAHNNVYTYTIFTYRPAADPRQWTRCLSSSLSFVPDAHARHIHTHVHTHTRVHTFVCIYKSPKGTHTRIVRDVGVNVFFFFLCPYYLVFFSFRFVFFCFLLLSVRAHHVISRN